MRKRIVLTTIGSLGDIHPYLAIALGLKRRGHHPLIATTEYYRSKIEGLGIDFAPVRPALSPDDRELLAKVMDVNKGTEFILRDIMFPHLRESYEDILIAVRGADLLVTHILSFGAMLVAEKSRIPWISTVLAPITFFSDHDPSVMAPAQYLAPLQRISPALSRGITRLSKRVARSWSRPFHEFRRELGLPPGADPLFEGQHSPACILALFSSALGPRQVDWPPQTRITGFPFYDEVAGGGMPDDLKEFLDSGPPPLVFTLGSAAVLDAGDFYIESASAATLLGERAVLITGRGDYNRLPPILPDGVRAFDYLPFAEIFPRASAIVHQGGIGTTAQALRAGRPMLVVPYAHDQPDNAARISRLGAGRALPRRRYSASRAAAEIRKLLDNPRHEEKTREVARQIRSENGVESACDAIEEQLALTTASR